jgi:predicted nucleic acid-binding protein
MYLLDNNVISEMRKIKTGKANQGVINWAKDKPLTELYTCEIVIMELLRWIVLKQRKDPVQAKHLQAWYDNFVMPNFEGRILTIDRKVSLICAEFHVPNPRPENDCWIASIAKAHDFTLVTRNLGDFEGLPIKIINPFI